MSETTKRRSTGTAKTSRKNQDSPAVELIVKRGALRRFDALKRKTAELPVTVSWDRRTDQRRGAEGATAADKRKAERRQMPPPTWELADFIVVERAAPAKRAAKKVSGSAAPSSRRGKRQA